MPYSSSSYFALTQRESLLIMEIVDWVRHEQEK